MNPYIIQGGIGNKQIVKEDLNTFLASIKDFEWTDNNLYKPAKVVEVKPTFATTSKYSYQPYESKNINFDIFYIEDSGVSTNFKQYRQDMENRRTVIQDKVQSKFKDFIDNYFPGEKIGEKDFKKELLELIKNNKLKIINNSSLSNKLNKYTGYLSQQQKNDIHDFSLLNIK
jgi:hypothetical protein